MASTM